MMPSPPCVPVRQRSRMSMHIDFIQQVMRSKGWANSSSPHPPKVLDEMLHEYLKQCWPLMAPWFHLIKAADVIRSVLWWQVTNSADAANQLSNVHAPTFIQLSTPHPSIIDWIPHATIRNMLILNQDAFDLDTVVTDLAAAYVYETESNEYSDGVGETRNLMDAVHNSLRCGMPLLGGAGLQTGSGQHVVATCGGESPPTTRKRPTAAAVVHQFKVDSSFFVQTGSGQHVVAACGGESPPTTRKRPTAAAVVHQFKVDSSFFAKYPALYDMTAVGKRAASPPVAFGNVPSPVQFTNSAAQAYMRTATSFVTV
ncbi:hypothetical protein V498_07941 [Pseudogymnoascus sp. VKM F-4517 (FW-2822)]|nr:hypothetical protein V498_07941 [Pseudogymnoascus sp. VKM F-4517 (FW-2822)]